MDHHQISHVNPFPCQSGVHEECLKVGDLILVPASWQKDEADHVVKDSTDHGQMVRPSPGRLQVHTSSE